MKRFMVEPYGWTAEAFEAATIDKAKYAAFKALREAGSYRGRDGFWRFLTAGVSVWEVAP